MRISGDNASLAVGVTALAMEHSHNGNVSEASRLAGEQLVLLESIDDPTLTIGAATAMASFRHEAGHASDVLHWSQTVIDWAHGDPAKGDIPSARSPLVALALVWRGIGRWWLGREGWRADLDEAVVLAPRTDPITHPGVVSWKYVHAVPHGVLLADDRAVRELEAVLQIAEASGEDTMLGNLKFTLGCVLADRHAPADRQRGVELLAQVREMCLQDRYFRSTLPAVAMHSAREQARLGDFEGAMPAMRNALDELRRQGQVVYAVWGTATLVDTLLQRGTDSDQAEAQRAIDSLAELPDDVGGVMRDIWLLRLRALLAKAHGDEGGYRDLRDHYRAMATSLGFEGHMQWLEEMA